MPTNAKQILLFFFPNEILSIFFFIALANNKTVTVSFKAA